MQVVGRDICTLDRDGDGVARDKRKQAGFIRSSRRPRARLTGEALAQTVTPP
jgi:hypothetical protein